MCDRPLGDQGTAHHSRTSDDAAGIRANGHYGRGGGHRTVHGRAADDGAEPAVACIGSGDFRWHHQLPDRDKLD